MMRRALAVLLCLTGAACDAPPTPEDEARQYAHDRALIEKAQNTHPPVEPLALQPISGSDIAKAQFSGAGCGFVPAGQGSGSAVLLVNAERGLLKLNGELATVAADSGSAELPFATRETYTGKAFALHLAKEGGEADASAGGAVRSPASLTIRDQWERIVYRAGGTLECGA